MLTQTTEIAIKSLVFLALRGDGRLTTPNEISRAMGSSPSYLAKVMGHLVKTGLLRSHRGPQGGMTLARPAEEITLLEIVEATQGLLVANYCEALGDDQSENVCGLHQAMKDVRESTMAALRRWTLADVVHPPTGTLTHNCRCHLAFVFQPTAQGNYDTNENGTPI